MDVNTLIPLAVYSLFAVTFATAGWTLVSTVRQALPTIRQRLDDLIHNS